MAKTYHEKLVSKASEYIRRIHSDTSVPLEQTLDSLEWLQEEISEYILAAKMDIEGKDGR